MMTPDATPLLAGLLVFAASALSLKLGISVAIFEILLGLAAGSLGMEPAGWMNHLAALGGILLTFLAGAEVDARLLKENYQEAAAIGLLSFLAPFAAASVFCRYAAGWSLQASLLAGIALSETSLAMVYSMVTETSLGRKKTGKLLMACTFLTNTLTALALSAAFLKVTAAALLLLAAAGAFLLFAGRFSGWLMSRPELAGKVIEPEIKYVFLILLFFIYLAELGAGQAMLPAFLFGLALAPQLSGAHTAVKDRLRTVGYAFITPFFFITAGMKVHPPALLGAAGLFAALFLVKQLAKFSGVYFLAARYFPEDRWSFTLLMSTGLTFGLMAAVYGFKEGILDGTQYSVLTGVLIASAVLPAFAAQRWFLPKEEEDLV